MKTMITDPKRLVFSAHGRRDARRKAFERIQIAKCQTLKSGAVMTYNGPFRDVRGKRVRVLGFMPGGGVHVEVLAWRRVSAPGSLRKSKRK